MSSPSSSELQDAHLWLPPGLLDEFGVPSAPPSPALARLRRLAAVEDLAAQLAAFGLLGPAKKPPPRAPSPPLVPVTVPANSYYLAEVLGRREQFGLGGELLVARGGRRGAVRPFFPPRAVQWPAEEGAGSGRVLATAALRRPAGQGRFAPARPCGGGAPAAKQPSGGTGVFLPRAEVYQTRNLKSAGVKPQVWHKQQLEEEEEEEEAAMGVAAEMQQRPASAAAPFHACPELLALPQEWTY